ncbi:hypothetical protein RUM44_005272 [Polyplax serrata]|uniref:Carbonic anhydrase n=1 Tax=Polyplax serrata TaxID=468196 RepID=A0ABR1AEJ0_POLSC
MPRSHCENENVHFVQDLAEVDGPFQSPININFKDLTKLELPSLCWNKSDACPKKMKITNTGHTVIITGKWKCERPYLTGGPLLGKYVFSQIHFHWGQDDCKGSEHLVSGESFPLEMHVAHFKADYSTQECALREKDGMVILVYLFKIQEEPNISLKRILNVLPNIKEANCFQPLDPKPILSLCNPFTDDYFMYWGSVVTSTCAHILMWLVCREPFGISREQIREFRKILDSSQQPICRNNRDIQPLHKRNVFHVNASKSTNCPMLPVKKIVGCFCSKGSEDNESVKSTRGCGCQGSTRNQEDIQGGFADRNCGAHGPRFEDAEPMMTQIKPPCNSYMQQSVLVQRATIQSSPLLPKLLENTYLGQLWQGNSIKEPLPEQNSTPRLATQSCCFITVDTKKVSRARIRPEKRISRRRTFNSVRALSQVMESLAALKNQTCKKLKEIDSINQEIKGIKSFCQGADDRLWLKKIEKIMTRQKRFTLRSSQGYFNDLKKFAKDCNIDQLFENKVLAIGDKSKMTPLSPGNRAPDSIVKTSVSKLETKQIDYTFSTKTQKLVRSFFEDIQENEDLQLTLQNDLKKRSRMSNRTDGAGDSTSMVSSRKGYITKKMFNMGNLEDRFFIEVPSEDKRDIKREWDICSAGSKLFVSIEGTRADTLSMTEESIIDPKETSDGIDTSALRLNQCIPLHRVNVPVGVSETLENIAEDLISDVENRISVMDSLCISTSTTCSSSRKHKTKCRFYSVSNKKEVKNYEQLNRLQSGALGNSVTNLSTDSAETQRMIIARFQKKQSRTDIRDQKVSSVVKVSSRGLCTKSTGKRQKLRDINLEGYYIKKKNVRSKRKKVEKAKNTVDSSVSSVSNEEINSTISVRSLYKWRRMAKARFELKIEGMSDGSTDSDIDVYTSRKAKLETKKSKVDDGLSPRADDQESNRRACLSTTTKETRATSDTTKTNVGDEGNDDFKTITISRPSSRVSSRRSERNESSTDAKDNSVEKPACEGTQPKKQVLNVIRTTKNRSFTNLSHSAKTRNAEITKRIFIQTNEERCRLGRDLLEMRRKMENDITPLDTFHCIAMKGVNKVSSESIKKLKTEVEMAEENQKLKVRLETPKCEESQLSSTLINLELTVNASGSNVPRSDVENCECMDQELQEVKPSLQTESIVHEEVMVKPSMEHLPKSESNKSMALGGPDMRGDSNPPGMEAKDLPSTVSYMALKKTSPSRPHSAESLTPLKKHSKKKRKKRPHCSKRISKHHMRKNSCVFRKPNKVDSRQANFLSLSNEEQLKIISANVAKYLKEKLVEENCGVMLRTSALPVETPSAKQETLEIEQEDLHRNYSYEVLEYRETHQEVEEFGTVPTDVDVREEKQTIDDTVIHVVDAEPIVKIFESEKLQEEEEEEEIQNVTEEVVESKAQKKSSKKTSSPTSPRPPLNFIKLNKLMAGKYKRSTESAQVQEPGKGGVVKKQSSQLKQAEMKKQSNSVIQSTKNSERNNKKPPTGSKTKSETERNSKSESKKRHTRRSWIPKRKHDADESQVQAVEAVTNSRAIESGRETSSLVPTYMMTSYLSPPIEKQKINQFLVNVNKKSMNTYLPEILYDKNDAVFAKDLENLIKLQMCLNNEIAANIENSMNYIKALLNQDYNGSVIVEKPPVKDSFDGYDSSQKGVLLIEMNDLNNCSSGSSDFGEDVDKFTYRCGRAAGGPLTTAKPVEMSKVKEAIGTEVEDAEKKNNPIFVQDVEPEEEYNSDSSCNCEISITLNGSSNELDAMRSTGNIPLEIPVSCGLTLTRSDSNTSRKTAHLDKSSSQSIVLKPLRKKRKENEISIEMKKKLLEILEGEIRREMALNGTGSTENSSDTVAIRWDDPSLANRSRSGTESGSENTEVLAQISETMRQYLSEYKRRRLVRKSHPEAYDQSKSEDDS